jgi:hypothetical protein
MLEVRKRDDSNGEEQQPIIVQDENGHNMGI